MYPPGYYPGMVAPPVLVGGLPLASFSDRFVGYLIDYLIKGVILAIPSFVVLWFMVFRDVFRDMAPTYPGQVPDLGSLFRKEILAFAIIVPIYLVGSYIYDVLLMYSSGQTIGKRIAKTRIVRLADGGPITLGIATRRWFVESVGGYLPGFVYLDCLWLLWDKPYQQCLHDKFARTTVVKVDQATAAVPA
jgi:uncharacterized RDD family membrane protein YckC